MPPGSHCASGYPVGLTVGALGRPYVLLRTHRGPKRAFCQSKSPLQEPNYQYSGGLDVSTRATGAAGKAVEHEVDYGVG